jgi:hypothetical protein
MVLVGVVIVLAGVLAASTFRGNVVKATPAPQTPGVTQPPVFGLRADSYSCGGTIVEFVALSLLPTAPPSGAISSEPVASQAGTTSASAKARVTTSATAAASVAGPGDPAVALAQVVSRYPSTLPATGWAPEASLAQGTVYVAANDKTPAPFAFVALALVGGKWVASAYGDCEPVVAPGAGSALSPIPWKVSGTVDKTATTLNLLFQSNLCGKAFPGPTVWYAQGNVTVTLWARATADSAGSTGSCSATVETAHYQLGLAEGIGSRQLRTGPASAAKPAEVAPVASGS